MAVSAVGGWRLVTAPAPYPGSESGSEPLPGVAPHPNTIPFPSPQRMWVRPDVSGGSDPKENKPLSVICKNRTVQLTSSRKYPLWSRRRSPDGMHATRLTRCARALLCPRSTLVRMSSTTAADHLLKFDLVEVRRELQQEHSLSEAAAGTQVVAWEDAGAPWHWLDAELSSNLAGETGAVYIYSGAKDAQALLCACMHTGCCAHG